MNRKKFTVLKPVLHFEVALLLIYGALYFNDETFISIAEFHLICWKSKFALIPILTSSFLLFSILILQRGSYIMTHKLQDEIRKMLIDMLVKKEQSPDFSLFMSYPNLPVFEIKLYRDRNVAFIQFQQPVKGYSDQFDKFVESKNWGVGALENVQGTIFHL